MINQFLLSVFAILGDGRVSFDHDIMPILSQKCLKCHGIDEESRKGKLRLDHVHSALKGGRSGKPALVPGKTDESEIYQRIIASEQNLIMPPVSTRMILTDKEKGLIKKWIEQGGKYEKHWSFENLKPVVIPQNSNAPWIKSPIDSFVYEKHRANGLSPAPEADKLTLVRRLYLDLIGLPPSPEQAMSFASDMSADSYEKLVEKLLASPSYGERWARRWMDLARYADTNGYEKDRYRSIWPWRDWVINALNSDLSFDQFSILQLAGDMDSHGLQENIVATGFHRNTMLNEEGGIDPLEFRYYAMVDRVNTTAATWLGLTLNCAQCHTHKYDPITHHDYYSLMAFLNNADDVEMDVGIQNQVFSKSANQQYIQKQKAISEKWLQTRKVQDKNLFDEWCLQQKEKLATWRTIVPLKMNGGLIQLNKLEDGSILGHGDISKQDVYELEFEGDFKDVSGIRLEVLPDSSLPSNGPGMCDYEGPRGDFFLGEIEAFLGGRKILLENASESYFKNHFGNGRAGAAQAVDGDFQTGWSCAGLFGQRHEAVFELNKLPASGEKLKIKMTFGRHYACPLGRFRFSVTNRLNPKASSFPEKVQSEILSDLPQELKIHTLIHYLGSKDEFKKDVLELQQLENPKKSGLTSLVLKERPATHKRSTFVYHRGEFLSPKETVDADLPSLFESDKLKNADRLQFARWLFSNDNPLTARVVVNRHWQAFFGTGLVKTLEDFGIQGEYPTHPELLDWLANDFRNSGWSVKNLHRTIVLSATYRQASFRNDGQMTNLRLLNVYPRNRLEAEVIRDSILATSGLLSFKIGGPGVFPPQPAGVTNEGTYGKLVWNTSNGEDRFRRGLYTFVKRTAPYAMFSTFDGPTGESCVARREVSNSPLQALSMMNDPVVMEAAEYLGTQSSKTIKDDTEMINHLYMSILTRLPSPVELKKLLDFQKVVRKQLDSNETDVKKLTNQNGDSRTASWIVVARALMNLDEAITKR